MKENSFFAGIRRSGWVRGDDRWIGGVCAGIAQKSGWDVSLVRGIVVILTLFFWVPMTLYGLAWLLLPDQRTGTILFQELLRGHVTGPTIGGIAASIIGVSNPFYYGFAFDLPWLWLLFAIGITGVIIAMASNKNTSDKKGTGMPSPNPQGPEASGPTPPGAPTTPPRSAAPPTPGPQGPNPYRRPTGPAPSYYQPAPNPPVTPKLSNAASLAVLGLLMLLAAALIIVTAVFNSQGFYLSLNEGAFGWALWSGVTLATLGLVLGVAALRGRRGGWLTGLSIFAAVVLIPTGSVGAAVSTYDRGISGFEYWNGWGFGHEVVVGTAGNESHSLIAGTQYFDFTTSDITATASTIELDLANIPDGAFEDGDIPDSYDIDLTASSMTLYLREDQAVNLSVDGTMSTFDSSGPGDDSWVKGSTGSFEWSGSSGKKHEDALDIDINMDVSTLTVVIQEAE